MSSSDTNFKLSLSRAGNVYHATTWKIQNAKPCDAQRRVHAAGPFRHKKGIEAPKNSSTKHSECRLIKPHPTKHWTTTSRRMVPRVGRLMVPCLKRCLCWRVDQAAFGMSKTFSHGPATPHARDVVRRMVLRSDVFPCNLHCICAPWDNDNRNFVSEEDNGSTLCSETASLSDRRSARPAQC